MTILSTTTFDRNVGGLTIKIYKCFGRFICCSLVILFSFEFSAAQSSVAQSVEKIQERRAFFFSRAEEFTYDSLKTTVFLTPLEQSILYGRLGDTWWQEKPIEARLWLQKAVREVESVPLKETETEKRQRLSTARLLLKIVARVDKTLTESVLAVLTSDPLAEGQDSRIAESLIEAALSVVDSDPQRSAELGAISIRYGISNSFASLIWRLQIRNPDLSRRLFLLGISVARSSRSIKWLSLLGFTAFTKGSNDSTDLSQDLKIELLKLYLEPLQGTPVDDENQKRLCGHVSDFIIPFVKQFSELIPTQVNQIAPIVSRCQRVFSPLEKNQADKHSETPALKTIEDYLRAADDEKDLKVKTIYQYKAAQMAARDRNYEKAISILDNMSSDSRKLLHDTWEGHRWEWAAAFALQLWKQGLMIEVNQVLEKVPTDIKGFAQVALVDKLPDKISLNLVVDQLSEASKNLDRSKSSDATRIEGFLVLMRLYAKYQQIDDAFSAFKKVTELVNKIASDESSENKNNSLSFFLDDQKIFLEGIPSIIFERREYAVRDAISSISFLPNRLRVRIELISLCLAEYKTISATRQKPNGGKVR